MNDRTGSASGRHCSRTERLHERPALPPKMAPAREGMGRKRMSKSHIQSVGPTRWLRAVAGAALAAGIGVSTLVAQDAFLVAPLDPAPPAKNTKDLEQTPEPREFGKDEPKKEAAP